MMEQHELRTQFWISSISENSDWLPANDPCTLLLGSGWRLPTLIEWETADATGGWDNYNETFASVLKLHAAGYLDGSDGLVTNPWFVRLLLEQFADRFRIRPPPGLRQWRQPHVQRAQGLRLLGPLPQRLKGIS